MKNHFPAETKRSYIPLNLAVASLLLSSAYRSAAGYLDWAYVWIDGQTWYQGGCPVGGTVSPDPNSVTVLRSTCQAVEAEAGGYNYYETGDPCVGDHICPQTLSIDPGGTGCDIELLEVTECSKRWRISNPKHSGRVTIKAELQGLCTTQHNPCLTEPAHWSATGYLQVVLPQDPPPPPGDGGGCGSGNLRTKCGGGPAPSFATSVASPTTDTGLDFRLNLGLASTTVDAAFIWLKSATSSVNLAKPVALSVPFERPGVVVTNGPDGAIKQVKVPQGLVNVSVKDACEYHLECFYQTNVGSLDTNGYYTTNASAFSTWVVKNPTGNTNTYNTLQIIEQRPGMADRPFQFAYTANNYMWDLQKPNGETNCACKLRISDTVTNYDAKMMAGGQVLRHSQRFMETRSGVAEPLVTQSVNGNGTLLLTNVYAYYSPDATNGASTNRLQRVDYSDGNWEYYKYDSRGRTQAVYSAYLNNSPPASGEPNPTNDHCKVVEFAYALTNQIGGQDFDGIDDGGDSFNPWSVRKIVVKLPVQVGANWEMHEVARTYHTSVWTNGYEETRECVSPGALWSNTNNLKTVTYWSTNADFTYKKPLSVTKPDALVTTWSYTTNTTTKTDPDGKVTVTTLDSLGQITSRTQTMGGITIASENFTYTDALEQNHDVTDLAGRTTHYTYACCGLDSVVDPDGATTLYDYDSLRREVATTRFYGGANGIKITNILDETGNILATKRQGTDSTWITLSQTQYDLLGRPTRLTNALGGVTTITNAIVSNRLCVTNTHPDGGTRTEVYYRDGRLEKVFGSAVQNPTHYTYAIEQDGTNGPWREFSLEAETDSNGSDSSNWTKTYTDAAGRSYKTLFAALSTPYPSTLSFFNSKGQLTNQVDPDGVSTIYVYNDKGEPTHTVLDTNRNYTIDYSGDDRITFVTNDVVSSHGSNVRRTRTYVWSTSGSATSNLVSISEVSVDGLQSWNTAYPDSSTAVVTSNRTVYAGSGNRYQTNVAPNGAYSVMVFSYGRLASLTRKDSSGTQISSTTHSYDAHGRQFTLTDARNGATTHAFNNADQITSMTTPNPGTLGGSALTTTTDYDISQRAWRITQPDGASTTNEFYPTGLRKRVYGGREYPAGYGYDSQGRMTKMTNWTSFATSGGERVTTWNYNTYRGWLENKRYPDNKGIDYTYSSAGRLQTRLWARGTNTTYTLDNLGAVSMITYNDGVTPGVTNRYDRRGRQTTVIVGTNSTSMTYNDANQLLSETNIAGTLAGLSVTNGYDQFMRRTNLATLNASTLLALSTYSYDAASRLSSVSDGTNSATYTYLANSPLVSQILFKSNTVTRLTTMKQYDYLNRLSVISNLPSAIGEPPISFAYDHNNANQRTRRVEADYSYWRYEYDSLGQVKSGKKYWSDQTPVAGQQFEYNFDDIGNRTSTRSGGDENGGNFRSANYGANSLNQYTNRDVPGYIDIIGQAFATSSVTVNALAAYRKGEYFRKESAVGNNSSALWTNVIVAATGQTSVTGNVFVAKTAEQFTYDYDGNLTSDGRWNYAWDAENRLIQMVANTAVGPQQCLKFQYDSNGRRIRKQTWSNTAGTNTPAADITFIYDGWNLLGTLSANSQLQSSFLWGLDLSGSLRGAGGVGGLVAASNSGTTNLHFAAFDGNGNVSALAKATDGTLSARYEYSPFGQLLRASGPMAKTSALCFSTKLYDNETDLAYYGLRHYNPNIGRWLNRDPIEEGGGQNLFAFVANNPVGQADRDGRDMVLREHFQEQLSPPTTGPYAGYSGLTYFDPFAPRAFAYKGFESPCCWKVYLTGYADLYSWWVRGTFAPDGTPARDHEMLHVAIHRGTFNSYVSSASQYVGICFTERQAKCFAPVIQGQMKNAWLAYNHTSNLILDCNTTGQRCAEVPAAMANEASAWNALAAALDVCAHLQ